MPGMTNYLRNKFNDWYLRGQTFVPPTSIFIELVSTTPTAGGGGTPLSGTGYQRIEVPLSLINWSGTQGAGSTAASSGTSGQSSNNAPVDFGTAGSNWGTASHWEAWDSLAGGERQFYGTITDSLGVPTPRSIVLGDPVLFPAGSLLVQWT